MMPVSPYSFSMALIEIDGLPIKSMVDLSMAMLNNQMVVVFCLFFMLFFFDWSVSPTFDMPWVMYSWLQLFL